MADFIQIYVFFSLIFTRNQVSSILTSYLKVKIFSILEQGALEFVHFIELFYGWTENLWREMRFVVGKIIYFFGSYVIEISILDNLGSLGSI